MVILDRPEKLNALTGRMLNELRRIARDEARRPDVRAVVVTGRGRAFSAGGDVTALFDLDQSAMRDYLGSYAALADDIEASQRPWVAAVNGIAFGGGLEIAAMCDIRVADEEARFCVADIEVGALPTGGLTWTLPRLVGDSLAAWMVLANAELDAFDAHDAGLVAEVTPRGECLDRAMRIASDIARFHPAAVSANRAALRHARRSTLAAARAFEIEQSVALLADPDIMNRLRQRFDQNRRDGRSV